MDKSRGFSTLGRATYRVSSGTTAAKWAQILDCRGHRLPYPDLAEQSDALDVEAANDITWRSHAAGTSKKPLACPTFAAARALLRRMMFFDLNCTCGLVVKHPDDSGIACLTDGLRLPTTQFLRGVIEWAADIDFRVRKGVR